MDTSEIFAKRLRNARVMKGYSMEDLAKSMDNPVSKMAISKYESGVLKPNSSTLISLSKALDVPVDYFFRPFIFKIDSIQFREKSSLPVKKEKSIKEQIMDIVERYSSIEEICNASVPFSPIDGEVKDGSDAIEAARKVRAKWNLGSDGIVNVIAMLEEHGVKIIELEAPSSFDGLSTMVNGIQPVIVLNNSLIPERLRFTALHELGHLSMNISATLDKSSSEHICNAFANEMLIPEREFKKAVGTSRKEIFYSELAYLQRQFGISCDALMYKARSANVISESSYRKFQVKKNSSSIYRRSVEKSLYPGEKSSRFECLVYQALSNNLISTSSAASSLNISVDSLKRSIEFQ